MKNYFVDLDLYNNLSANFSSLLIKFEKQEKMINKIKKNCHKKLGFLENCVGGKEEEIQEQIKIYKELLKMLEDKEV